MQSSSRRAFLMGRRSSQSPWDAFCQRLSRIVAGTFFDLGLQDGNGSARLTPKQAADVHHARALCAEYGVLLALDGVPHAVRSFDQSVLWVDPGFDMAGCERLSDDSTRWFVQPGCLLGDLDASGLRQFAGLPLHLTAAAWLADRALCGWDSGATHQAGLEHASVLLADGTSVSLGPFGTHDQKPLDSPSLQRLIPSLFELAGQTHAQTCRQEKRWPARYRLDALLPAPGQTINLAHLMLGHGGDLGWVEWLVFSERPRTEPSGSQAADGFGYSSGVSSAEDETSFLASDLDARVKALFDPSGVFPHPGQDL